MNNGSIFKTEDGRQAILASYDSLLNRWPTSYETYNISTRHGDTFIIASGDQGAPPLILLHGSSSNSAVWIGDITEYCRHYRVYAVDIPGDPGRSEAKRFELDRSAAEWMEDIYKGLHINRAVILGISMGGWMALKFAVENPELVEKLVLICPSGIGPQKKSFMVRIIPLMFLGNWGLKQVNHIVYGNSVIPEEAMQYSLLIGKNFCPRVEKIPIFTDGQLERLDMPILLIAGEKDALLQSQKTIARASKLFAQVIIELIPGAGHVLINLTERIIPFLCDNNTEQDF